MSLRSRVMFGGLGVIAVVLVTVNIFVYFAMRAELHSNLDQLVSERSELVLSVADASAEPRLLAEQLSRLGVRARIRTADGEEIFVEPTVRRAPPSLPPPSGRLEPFREAAVLLDADHEVLLLVSEAGTRHTLRRLLVLQIAGTAVGLATAALLLSWASTRSLAPLSRLLEVIRRVNAGGRSDRVRLESAGTEVGRLSDEFDQMLDTIDAVTARAENTAIEARRSDEASTRFLADAAHQLRTPITGIRAAADVLSAPADVVARDELIDALRREAARAGELVDRLLRLAHFDRGGIRGALLVDIGQLCAEEVARVRALTPRRVEVHVPQEPVMAWVERGALSEALANLLDNACRHAASRIAVQVERSGDIATVRVEDDGPGLPDAVRAFDRFVSLDGMGGSGLGLAIAVSVARAHGGHLGYANRAFHLTLPADQGRTRSTSVTGERDQQG